ncbi:aromatic amino acid exporter YddG [Xanthobacter agilis]|uniref:aromatic amino acid exporter YddG n=1 Tax=Xanthobacter agilis TaxID=47492 RepID=UPI00372B35DC
MTSASATRIGLLAIALWATLALLTAATGQVPAFLLTALTFAIGGLVGLGAALAGGGGLSGLKVLVQRPMAYVHGVGGLFGYHFLYFAALKLAPPAEAGLINYLWPLLIVLLSATLPGGGLKRAHVLGALMGFAGTVVLLVGKSGFGGIEGRYVPGYLAAFACAFIWAIYSVASRRFADVPTQAVAGFCLVTALLAGLCHLAWEETVWPADARQWAAVIALGVGPVGVAFYAWDIGMKKGDVRLLGVASYAAPVLSTLLLVAAGYAAPTAALALACAFIVGGAVVATRRAR